MAISSKTHLEKTKRWLRGIGVEIGAFLHPVEGIKPIYVDKFSEYAGHKCLADYKGDAEELPFFDDSLDYVVSSHVLEHVANPVKALAEWYRVLKPGGVIYLVVPDKRYTFDHKREVTSVEHMREDFSRNTSSCDGTHIADFIENVDWDRYMPAAAPEERDAERNRLREAYTAAVQAGLEINIHFHVFSPEIIKELIAVLAIDTRRKFYWELVDFEEQFPADRGDGIFAVIKVNKSFRQKIGAVFNSIRNRKQKSYPVLPNATSFA